MAFARLHLHLFELGFVLLLMRLFSAGVSAVEMCHARVLLVPAQMELVCFLLCGQETMAPSVLAESHYWHHLYYVRVGAGPPKRPAPAQIP
jgi:hypothetical protein